MLALQGFWIKKRNCHKNYILVPESKRNVITSLKGN